MDVRITVEMLDQIISDTAAIDGHMDDDSIAKLRAVFLEPLEVVDDAGNVLGAAPRGLVHRVGLRHTVVYCVVYDAARERILLQSRGSGRLDISVGGHVKAEEPSYSASLAREFEEELGFAPDSARFEQLTVYNRDAEMRPDRPLVRNRERRYVFRYTLTSKEERQLSIRFESRAEKDAVLGFSWVVPSAVAEAVKARRCADGLAASLEHIAL